MGSDFNNRNAKKAPTIMAKSIAKLRVAKKFHVDQLSEQPLFATNPEAALPLLSMIEQAQLSIEDLLGHLSRQFIEQ